jgi:hypothetical protein
MKNIALMILTLLVALSGCSKSTSPSTDSILDRGDVIVLALAKFKCFEEGSNYNNGLTWFRVG